MSKAEEITVSHSIYRHIDPRSGETRYVGRSINPEVRYAQHMAVPGNDEMREWHEELRALGLKPVLDIIEIGIVDVDKAKEREWYWIEYYIDLGNNLTNYILLTHIRRGLIKCLSPWVWTPLPIVPAENIVELERRRANLQGQCQNIIRACGYKSFFCKRKGVNGLYWERDLYIRHESEHPHRDLIMRFEEMDTINSLEFYEEFLVRVQEIFASCGGS